MANEADTEAAGEGCGEVDLHRVDLAARLLALKLPTPDPEGLIERAAAQLAGRGSGPRGCAASVIVLIPALIRASAEGSPAEAVGREQAAALRLGALLAAPLDPADLSALRSLLRRGEFERPLSLAALRRIRRACLRAPLVGRDAGRRWRCCRRELGGAARAAGAVAGGGVGRRRWRSRRAAPGSTRGRAAPTPRGGAGGARSSSEPGDRGAGVAEPVALTRSTASAGAAGARAAGGGAQGRALHAAAAARGRGDGGGVFGLRSGARSEDRGEAGARAGSSGGPRGRRRGCSARRRRWPGCRTPTWRWCTTSAPTRTTCSWRWSLSAGTRCRRGCASSRAAGPRWWRCSCKPGAGWRRRTRPGWCTATSSRRTR
jgi:hypothetical protein